MEHNPRSVTLAADRSSGQQADVELAEDNVLWVAAGPGIEVADIWMKGIAGVVDLRVRVSRDGLALEVSIDRGEQSDHWWPEDGLPTSRLTLDTSEGVALAKASAGADSGLKSIEFDAISI